MALVIQDLTDGGDGQANGGDRGAYDAPRSPDMGMNGQPWQETGYTTPFGNSGAPQNNWNQGSTTPYGATPYGNSGGPGWP